MCRKQLGSLALIFSIFISANWTPYISAQEPEPLSVHVLDNTNGGDGPGISCRLFKKQPTSDEFDLISTKVTDENGRADLLAVEEFEAGIYRISLDTKTYFEAKGMDTFWPVWETTFNVKNPLNDYHVPVTLSPYGFGTYRGS